MSVVGEQMCSALYEAACSLAKPNTLPHIARICNCDLHFSLEPSAIIKSNRTNWSLLRIINIFGLASDIRQLYFIRLLTVDHKRIPSKKVNKNLTTIKKKLTHNKIIYMATWQVQP